MVLVSHSVLSVSQLAQDHIQSCGHGPGISFSPLSVTIGPGPCPIMWTWSWSLIQSSRCHNWPRTMTVIWTWSWSRIQSSRCHKDHIQSCGHGPGLSFSPLGVTTCPGPCLVMWTWSWSLLQSSRCHNWPRTITVMWPWSWSLIQSSRCHNWPRTMTVMWTWSWSLIQFSRCHKDHIQSCAHGPGLSFSPLGVTTGPGPCPHDWTWSWSLIQSSRCHNWPRTMSDHVDMVLVSHSVLSVSQLAQMTGHGPGLSFSPLGVTTGPGP